MTHKRKYLIGALVAVAFPIIMAAVGFHDAAMMIALDILVTMSVRIVLDIAWPNPDERA
jgi:hypothetical protein